MTEDQQKQMKELLEAFMPNHSSIENNYNENIELPKLYTEDMHLQEILIQRTHSLLSKDSLTPGEVDFLKTILPYAYNSLPPF